MRSVAGRFYVAGRAAGPALVLSAPLSFWGGVAVETGEIIDRSHPDRGQRVTDRVLVMLGGRGSSSSSSVLAEALRRGTGPAAIILARSDAILTVGAIVAQSLYGCVCPIVVAEIEGIATGDSVAISAQPDGAARITIGDAGGK